jgi:hypothetical protein
VAGPSDTPDRPTGPVRLTRRCPGVNELFTPGTDHRSMEPRERPRPSWLEIPLLAAGAMATFATLVALVAGDPPPLPASVAFGVLLGLILLVQRWREERRPGAAASPTRAADRRAR